MLWGEKGPATLTLTTALNRIKTVDKSNTTVCQSYYFNIAFNFYVLSLPFQRILAILVISYCTVIIGRALGGSWVIVVSNPRFTSSILVLATARCLDVWDLQKDNF